MKRDRDLHYYYVDLHRLPRQSDEERRHLIACMYNAQGHLLSTAEATRARHRLIEGYMRLATSLATTLCHPSRYQSLPDLVQEANLALVQAVYHYDALRGENFTSFAYKWMHGRVTQADAERTLIRVTGYGRATARKAGTLEQVYAMQPISLDRLLDETDPDSDLLDLVEAPPPAPPPQRDEGKRAQVETLLSYLSPRAQAVIRLRYGLAFEEDECPRSIIEIAHELGISRSMAKLTEQDAMHRLQALATGQATISKRNGKPCISLCSPALASQRQETRMRARLHKLEEAYAKAAAVGKTPSGTALARRAGVNKQAALQFLRTRQQQQAATSCKS